MPVPGGTVDRDLTTLKMNLKQSAEMYRIGLVTGFYSVADIVDWAESIIDSDPERDLSLFELVMSGQSPPDWVSERLAAVPGVADRRDAIGRLLREMAQDLERDRGEAARIATVLDRMALADYVPDEDATDEMRRLGSGPDLPENIWPGSEASWIDDIIAFLRCFADRSSVAHRSEEGRLPLSRTDSLGRDVNRNVAP